MKEAYRIAFQESEKQATRNERYFNRRARASVLDAGDRVLIRNVRERGGPGKIRSFWEQQVYRVCERKEDSPVYVVEPERGGERRTVHRNMLFHCGEELPDVPDEKDVVCQKTKDASKVGKRVTFRRDEQAEKDENESSDSDDDETVQIQQTPRTRQKTNRLNYAQLGKPTVNMLYTAPKQRDSYRQWLEQLWTLGFMTNQLIKQRFPASHIIPTF